MKRNIKRILSVTTIALTLSLSVSSLAATIYVGNTGFDANKVAGSASYKSAFEGFLVKNVGSGVKVDFNDDGKAVDTNAFANSGSTNIAEFDTKNGVTVPSDYKVWDGTGTPEAPEVPELDFKVEDIF